MAQNRIFGLLKRIKSLVLSENSVKSKYLRPLNVQLKLSIRQKFWLLTHFSPLLHFYTPWKHQETFGFLTFSGVKEMEHWVKMGWGPKCSQSIRVEYSLILSISWLARCMRDRHNERTKQIQLFWNEHARACSQPIRFWYSLRPIIVNHSQSFFVRI